MRVSDQGTQTCGQPPRHTPSSGHLTPTFSFPRPLSPQPPLLLMRRITYTGSVGARGPPVTASFLSQILTKKDAEGCASSSVNFRDTCRSPGYFCVARLLLGVCYFPPTPPKKKQQSAQLNGRSRGLYYTEVGGGTRTKEGGSAEGGKGSAPNLYPSCTRARWGIRRVLCSVCWLIWAHHVLQEWASWAPIWHSLIRKEIEGGGSELAGCSIHKCQPWSNSPRSGIQHFWWYLPKTFLICAHLKEKCGKITHCADELQRAECLICITWGYGRSSHLTSMLLYFFSTMQDFCASDLNLLWFFFLILFFKMCITCDLKSFHFRNQLVAFPLDKALRMCYNKPSQNSADGDLSIIVHSHRKVTMTYDLIEGLKLWDQS